MYAVGVSLDWQFCKDCRYFRTILLLCVGQRLSSSCSRYYHHRLFCGACIICIFSRLYSSRFPHNKISLARLCLSLSLSLPASFYLARQSPVFRGAHGASRQRVTTQRSGHGGGGGGSWSENARPRVQRERERVGKHIARFE